MAKQILDGGDLLVKCLLKEGISKIFGLVGGELSRIYDAIERWAREEGIDTVMVRHEQAGGHMADAWARATGEIGVCMGTVGPGVSHLVPAVAAAYAVEEYGTQIEFTKQDFCDRYKKAFTEELSLER